MNQNDIPETFGQVNDIGIDPIALIFTIVMGLLMIFLPRKYVIFPLIVASVFIPINQRIIIAGLDFFMLRILILFGWIRLLLKREFLNISLNKIDILIIAMYISSTIIYFLQWLTLQSLIYRLGIAFDAIGAYFLFRILIRSYDDIKVIINTLAIIALPLALFMFIERITGRNIFSIFGGVPEFTVIRDGSLRCQGAFFHPIMAGSFGAALFPLFISQWYFNFKGKIFAVIGTISSILIVFFSSSSGPVMALFVAIFGLGFWFVRDYMYYIRWGTVLLLIALHIVMKAPVWALVARAKIFGSSTGYHRYVLIDQFINRFEEWWLLGTKSTAHWGHYGVHLWDITNHYIRVAVDGGLLTLILFLVIIWASFGSIGTARKILKISPATEKMVWMIGVSFFVHLVSFMSVSYFDQTVLIWYMTLAIISVIFSLNKEINSKLLIVGLKNGNMAQELYDDKVNIEYQ